MIPTNNFLIFNYNPWYHPKWYSWCLKSCKIQPLIQNLSVFYDYRSTPIDEICWKYPIWLSRYNFWGSKRQRRVFSYVYSLIPMKGFLEGTYACLHSYKKSITFKIGKNYIKMRVLKALLQGIRPPLYGHS